MVTPNLEVMRWSKLVDQSSIGKTVRVTYSAALQNSEFDILKIVGTGHIYGQHVLIVQKIGDDNDDVYIVMREGIGKLWNAYEMTESIEI